MSINLMSAIFRTEFRDLQDAEGNTTKASTAKFVCLALADHANDEGEGAYPSINKMAYKTNLSRTAVINALDALKHNGVLTANGPSKHETINYTVNPACFSVDSAPSALVNPVDPVRPLDPPQYAHLTPPVRPLDPNHPLTIPEPSYGAEAPKALDWELAHGNPITQGMLSAEMHRRQMDAANIIATGMGSSIDDAYALSMAFLETRNIVISVPKLKSQRKALAEMIEMKVRPEHVRQAVTALTEKGMTVTDLFSVVKTAIDLANPAPAQQKESEFETL